MYVRFYGIGQNIFLVGLTAENFCWKTGLNFLAVSFRFVEFLFSAELAESIPFVGEHAISFYDKVSFLKSSRPRNAAPGLPDFSWYNIPKRENYTK
jgi:hypothetical protein